MTKTNSEAPRIKVLVLLYMERIRLRGFRNGILVDAFGVSPQTISGWGSEHTTVVPTKANFVKLHGLAYSPMEVNVLSLSLMSKTESGPDTLHKQLRNAGFIDEDSLTDSAINFFRTAQNSAKGNISTAVLVGRSCGNLSKAAMGGAAGAAAGTVLGVLGGVFTFGMLPILLAGAGAVAAASAGTVLTDVPRKLNRFTIKALKLSAENKTWPDLLEEIETYSDAPFP
jgi:hypothetical protein